MKHINILAIISMAVALLLVATASAEDTPCWACHEEGEVNVRAGAGRKYDELSYLCPGDEAVLIATSGWWTHIKVANELGEGWVHADYITIDPDAAGEYINESGKKVIIRDGVGGPLLRKLARGGKVEIAAVTMDADGVRWGCTGDGWVQLRYLTQEVADDE